MKGKCMGDIDCSLFVFFIQLTGFLFWFACGLWLGTAAIPMLEAAQLVVRWCLVMVAA